MMSAQPIHTPRAIAPPQPPVHPSRLGQPLELSQWNQRTYERLKLSLGLDLRRQVFVAVCDDLVVRAHLSNRLTRDRATVSSSGDVLSQVMSVTLEPKNPKLHSTLANAFRQYHRHCQRHNPRHDHRQPPLQNRFNPPQKSEWDPVIQVFGIEQLTRQCAHIQQQFLDDLNQLPQRSRVNTGALLLWIPRPWVHSIRQSAPDFWQWHTGLFEFEGDPRPLESVNTVQSQTAQSTFQPQLQGLKPFLGNAPQPSPPRESSPTPAAVTPNAVVPNALDAWLVLAQSAQAEPSDRPLMNRAIEMGHHLLRDRTPIPREQIQIYEALGICHRDQALALAQDQRKQAQSAANKRDIARDLEESCNCFCQALTQVDQLLRSQTSDRNTSVSFLSKRAELGRLLGETQGHRIRYGSSQDAAGEIAEVQRAMVTAYRQAIAHQWQSLRQRGSESIMEPVTETAAPWLVQTYNSLGMAYWTQGNGLPASDRRAQHLFKQAIHAYTQGIKRYQEGSPLDQDYHYGTLQTNLGTAYLTLHRGDRQSQWLHQAVLAYHAALTQRPVEQYPAAHAATCNNLGIAYRALAHLAKTQDPHAEWTYCQQAIAAYDQAIAIDSHIAVTFDRATTARQLAQLHQYLAHHPLTPNARTLTGPDPTSPNRHLSAAIQAYSHGLQCLSSNANGQPLLSGLISTAKTILQGHHGISPQTLLAQVPAQWLPLVIEQL